MRSLRHAWYYFSNVLHHEKKDRELDDEVRSYANLLSDEHRARGLSPDQARRAAQLDIGGLEQTKEEIRERRTGAPLSNFLQDLRYGARMLAKKPGFAAVSIATLALGIGANTAIFSVVNATLLTPIPIPAPDRVAVVWTENLALGFHNFPASVPDYRDWQASGVFSDLAAFNNQGLNLRDGDRSERVEGLLVTPEWFRILGRQPILGRTFNAAEAQPGRGDAVVLGWDFWHTKYNADPAVIGKSLTIDGTPHTVIGVMPKNLPNFEHEELYVPAVFDGPAAHSRSTRSWGVLGRIAPGLSWATAQQRMNTLNLRIRHANRSEDRGQTLRLQPVEDVYVQDIKPLVVIVFCAVGFVLLVACANIANLLLARGTARQREIAIRAALGASRLRIFSQLLSESVLLAILGAVAGIIPALIGIRLIPKLSNEIPNANLIALNGTVLLFAFALSLFAAVVFGLLPALQFRKADTNQPLRNSERGLASRRQHRLGSLFVIAEVAFTMVLLAGAGLMVRSLAALRNRNPGYDPHQALTMEMALTGPQFRDPKKQIAFLDAALTQIGALPGIETAAATDAIPGGETIHGAGLRFTDRPEPRPVDVPIVLSAAVSPAYFSAMRIPLKQGRIFTPADNASAPQVVVIDEAIARKHWPRQNPIGKSIRLKLNTPPRTIIGIVGSVEQNAAVKLAVGDIGEVYRPLAQDPQPGMALVVRNHTDPATLIPEIRRTISHLDRDVPLYKIQTLEELHAAGRETERIGSILLGLFSAIALLLASIGVFGVISHTVGQRIREFGIRAALGAGTADLLKLTLGQGALLVAIGAALGLLGAVALTRLMRDLLTGISPNDPLCFTAATFVLVSVGLLASYLPARRASRVDPTIALRAE